VDTVDLLVVFVFIFLLEHLRPLNWMLMTYLQHPHSIDPSSTSSFQADTDNMTSASTQSVDAIELLVLNFNFFF
jgi:hypothetical protein